MKHISARKLKTPFAFDMSHIFNRKEVGRLFTKQVSYSPKSGCGKAKRSKAAVILTQDRGSLRPCYATVNISKEFN